MLARSQVKNAIVNLFYLFGCDMLNPKKAGERKEGAGEFDPPVVFSKMCFLKI